MPSIIATVAVFPYTFPFTFEGIASYVQVADYEPVLMHPRDFYGFYSLGESGGTWTVMQLSTPTFLPDGTGAASPTSTSGVNSGQTSTEAI